MRIAINGFGRIGRSILKICIARGMNVVAINDLHGVKDAAYLLKHDSVYGLYNEKVSIRGEDLIVKGKKIHVLSESDPGKLPWKELKVDVVIESTGAFRDCKAISKHLDSGAKRVVTTKPLDNPDITIVAGVNDKKLNCKHKIISIASCTTNCVAPVLSVINKSFGIKKAFLTTIHAYTRSQEIIDSSHDKPRRGRAAAINIVPTTTGASKAIIDVMPELKGKLKGIAVRVPIPDGSLADIVIELNRNVNEKKVNAALKAASKKGMKGIIEYSEEELVSSDVIGNAHSAVVDSKMTQAEGNLIKILAWYDNEYGYSSRVVDCVKLLGRG